MLRDLPSTPPQGCPIAVRETSRRRHHDFLASLLRAAAVALVGGSLAIGLAIPQASADDLDDQKARIEQQLVQTRSQLNHSTQELNTAAAAVERSRIELEDAQAQLALTRVELAKAEKRDAALEAKLAAARKKLAKTRKQIESGVAKLDAQRGQVGAVVQSQWQQKTNLMPVAVLAQSGSTRDLQTRLQLSKTMFDASESKMKALQEAQRALNAKRAEQTTIEAEIAVDRKAAADNLELRKGLEARAAGQAQQVTALVAANVKAQQSAAAEVTADQQQYAQLTAERAETERLIKARIEAQRRAAAAAAAAEAAKRAAEARAAEARRQAELRAAQQRAAQIRDAQARAAANRAAEQRAAEQKAAQERQAANNNSNSGGNSNNSSGGSAPSGGGLSLPVSAPITSPFGMRFHPVLKVYKLHDGTDFGAGCGTPIRAVYSGTVVQKQNWNTALGNRVVIDHGSVNGTYVSAGYNHAMQPMNVSVGQRVSKGQVIGYVGTTGYSTGCHLHFQMWKNGNISNPMSMF